MRRPTELVTLPNFGQVEYRLDKRGGDTVLIFHGGHMNAGLALGEEVFASAGYSSIIASRPGYGRTPLSTGRSAAGFAEVCHRLCEHLGIARLAAVVGISAGGRTAMVMAARYPDLVERLILQSAVGSLPWPDRRTRIAANVAFAAATERLTWAAVRKLMRARPDLGLRLLLRDLSTRPVREVVTGLRDEDRTVLIELFGSMRSGHGFLNDLIAVEDVARDITQPTLIIASRNDRSVPIAHAEALAATIEHAELIESRADSHFIWFGDDWPHIARKIQTFLAG